MITYSKLKLNVLAENNLLDSFVYQGDRIAITNDLAVYVNNKKTDLVIESLEEAREDIVSYIKNNKLVNDIDNIIPEEKIATLIRKYHKVNKITDTLVESYIELASSNMFSIDPVITEIKRQTVGNFNNKLEYTLNDGSVVAIDEETQSNLSTLLKNKYEIIDYMRESKNNFMYVIKQIGE